MNSPPYYSDDPVFRQDWAAYLESVRQTDHHVGQILKRLEEDGILNETLVLFMTDVGISHARGKPFNYREGTHIPFVVRLPADGTLQAAPGNNVAEFQPRLRHPNPIIRYWAVMGLPVLENASVNALHELRPCFRTRHIAIKNLSRPRRPSYTAK